jgi:hypothetical protein
MNQDEPMHGDDAIQVNARGWRWFGWLCLIALVAGNYAWQAAARDLPLPPWPLLVIIFPASTLAMPGAVAFAGSVIYRWLWRREIQAVDAFIVLACAALIVAMLRWS